MLIHHYKTISISNFEFLIKHIIIISDKKKKRERNKKLINIGIHSNSMSGGYMKENSM